MIDALSFVDYLGVVKFNDQAEVFLQPDRSVATGVQNVY